VDYLAERRDAEWRDSLDYLDSEPGSLLSSNFESFPLPYLRAPEPGEDPVGVCTSLL